MKVGDLIILDEREFRGSLEWISLPWKNFLRIWII